MSFDLSRRNLWEARTDCKLVRILGTAIVGQVLDHDMSREPSAGLGGCTLPHGPTHIEYDQPGDDVRQISIREWVQPVSRLENATGYQVVVQAEPVVLYNVWRIIS